MTVTKEAELEDERADYLFCCDKRGCKAAADCLEMTFYDAVRRIKGKGWKIRKVMGTWHHYCPEHDT